MLIKKTSLYCFFIILIQLSICFPVWGELVSDPVTDELEDGFDYNIYYNDNFKVPVPLILDAINSGVLFEDSRLGFFIDFSTPIPIGLPYSLQIALDTDNDTATGKKDPEWYYNQLGVDCLIEVEHTGIENIGGVYKYDDGVWVKTGETDITIDETRILVSINVSSIGDSQNSSFMVYVKQGIALDMVPEEGKTPITFIIAGDSPIIVTDPDLVTVYIFDYPSLIEEGIPFELDASANSLDATLTYIFEWDLNGDGVYDIYSETPKYIHEFHDDGEYPVSLRITDSSGISGEVTKLISVKNTPPYDAQIITSSIVESGQTLTLSGRASDLGNDQLTYTWEVDGKSLTGNPVTLSFDTPGERTITLTVTDQDGATTQVSDIITVNASEKPMPDIDPLLVILVAFFGIMGFSIYKVIKPKVVGKQEQKKEPDKEKGFCEEHPEVVEEEEKACWDAQMELDNAVGDVQDNLDNNRDQWRADVREVSRTIMEWDIAYGMIQSLTKSEEELKKDAETVQKIAGLVQTGGKIGKTAFKKGGEEALKEVGKYMASETGKSIASGLSSTINDVLSLETWAYTELGTGIAKLITGEDPKKEASNIRKKSLSAINILQSWIDSDIARSTRYTSRTLHTCIEEAQKLLDDLKDAMNDFEEAISGFRCVNCEIPDNILEEIDSMIKEIEAFMKTFGDLIDQVEQRLAQAIALLGRKDVYESPLTWLHAQNNQVPNIQKSLQKSEDMRRE